MNPVKDTSNPFIPKSESINELVPKLKAKTRVKGLWYIGCIFPAIYLAFSTIYFHDSGAELGVFIKGLIIILGTGPFTVAICGILLFLISFSSNIEKRATDIKICTYLPLAQLLLAVVFMALDSLYI